MLVSFLLCPNPKSWTDRHRDQKALLYHPTQHGTGAYSERANKSIKSSSVQELLLAPKSSRFASLQPCTRPPQLLLSAGRARQLGCSTLLLLLRKVGFCSRCGLSHTRGLCALVPCAGYDRPAARPLLMGSRLTFSPKTEEMTSLGL